MDSGVEPDLDGPGEVLLPAVAVADDQVVARVRDMMAHALELAPSVPDSLGADDHVHRAVWVAHQDALAFFDDVKPHA